MIPTITGTDPAVLDDLLNAIGGAANTDIGALDTRIDSLESINVADLNAIGTASPEGKILHVDDMGANFQAQDAAWVQITDARFASTGDRDTAYAKAAGAYLVAGARAIISGVTYRYSGSAWVAWSSGWITYTPTLTNITLGTGSSVVGKYQYVKGDIDRSVEIVLGTGGSVGTDPTVTFPVLPATPNPTNRPYAGTILFQDASTLAVVSGTAIFLSPVLRLLYFSGSPSSGTGITSTAPFTWAVGDFIMIRDQYTP